MRGTDTELAKTLQTRLVHDLEPPFGRETNVVLAREVVEPVALPV